MLKLFYREKKNTSHCHYPDNHCCCKVSYESVEVATIRKGDVLVPTDSSYMPNVLRDYLFKGVTKGFKKVKVLAVRKEFILVIPNHLADMYPHKMPDDIKKALQWAGSKESKGRRCSSDVGSKGFWVPMEGLTYKGECDKIKVQKKCCCC